MKSKYIPLALAGALAATFIGVGSGSAASSGDRQTIRGSGQDVPSLKSIRKPVIVKLRHTGSSNFAVWAINSRGAKTELWVNEIGRWSGTVFQERPSRRIVAADVTADGRWQIKVRPLKAARNVKPRKFSGSGASVIDFKRPSRGFKRIRLIHKGSSNFAVWSIDRKGRRTDLLANEIGRFRGRTVLPSGTRYLSIQADGRWTGRVR